MRWRETIPASEQWTRQWILIPGRGEAPLGSIVLIGENDYYSVINGATNYMHDVDCLEEAKEEFSEQYQMLMDTRIFNTEEKLKMEKALQAQFVK